MTLTSIVAKEAKSIKDSHKVAVSFDHHLRSKRSKPTIRNFIRELHCRFTFVDLTSRLMALVCLVLIAPFGWSLLGVAARASSTSNKLTKLAPEPVTVLIENGSGSLDVVFRLEPVSNSPAIKVTSAVGSSTAIPETDITFSWSSAHPLNQAPDRTLLVAKLNVKTSVFVEPNVEHKGRLIFLWSDSEQIVDFSVVDKSSLAFDLSESKLDLVLGPNDPPTVSLKIKNTGRAQILRLTTSSSPLIDSETQHRTALITSVNDFRSAPIQPNQESEVAVALPAPALAGSYSGTLDVVANDSLRKSIPIVLRTRGPVMHRRLSFLPLVLFFATLALGFIISTKLDEWFNLGGLRQSEALLSLQQSEHGLTRLLDKLRRLEKDLAATVFAQTTIRLDQSLQELRELLGAYSDTSRDQLIVEAQRYALILTQANLLRGFVEIAMKRWGGDAQKATLMQVLTALDAVPPDADLNKYRESLRKTLSESADDSGASLTAVNEALPRVPPPGDLRAKIVSMARLQRTVVLVVVFISAYQIFYAHHFSFGTLLDYLGVFLWTLGLTQTGSQILTRVRSNPKPAS